MVLSVKGYVDSHWTNGSFSVSTPSDRTDDRAHLYTGMPRTRAYPSSMGEALNPLTMG